MSYPEEVKAILLELDSKSLSANTEDKIKRILMATLELWDMATYPDDAILERALRNKEYYYELD